jgi:hypothetical protein
MAEIKKGNKLVCVPCGRELTVSNWGVSRATLWCCGKPMDKKGNTKVTKKKK